MRTRFFQSTALVLDASFDDRFHAEHNRSGVAAADLFIVESEGVVGVFSHHPLAVTIAQGDISDFVIDFLIYEPQELKQLVDSITVAVDEARRRHFAVNPKFMCFASE